MLTVKVPRKNIVSHHYFDLEQVCFKNLKLNHAPMNLQPRFGDIPLHRLHQCLA